MNNKPNIIGIILLVIFLLATIICNAKEFTKGDIYHAIAVVESGLDTMAIGDGGDAVGMYQIHKIYVDDVNRIANTSYTYNDRFNKEKSLEMVKIYLNHYSKVYKNKTGKEATNEVKARIHNGGPDGWSKKSTERYWKKVKKYLQE